MIKLCVRSVICIVNCPANHHCAFIVAGSCLKQVILVDHFVTYSYNLLCIYKALEHPYSTYRSAMSFACVILLKTVHYNQKFLRN